MIRRYAATVILVPVLLAAWLTLRSEPVTGLQLSQVIMYQAPEETSGVALARQCESGGVARAECWARHIPFRQAPRTSGRRLPFGP